MNFSDHNNLFGENQNSKLTYVPNFSHAFHNLIIPFNNSFVEVPDAKAEDLTPRSGWIARVNDIERKLLDERNKNRILQDRIRELEFGITNMESTAHLNIEQLSSNIFALNKEIESYKRKEEAHKNQLKQEMDYNKSIQDIAKENEEKYTNHLNKIRIEYESLQAQLNQLTQSYNNLNKEHAILQGTNIELRSELSKLQGIYSAEKTVLQAQTHEAKSEQLKLAEKFIELTRQAERSNVEASMAGEKISQLQRENRDKDSEIKRLTDLLTMAESRAQALSSEQQDNVFNRAEALSAKFREEKLDLEMKIKIEQNNSTELSNKVHNLNESNAKYRLEAENLKIRLKETENELHRIRASERELLAKFDQVKKKHDEHFEKIQSSAFASELRNTKLTQQIETLNVEKEFQEKLIFQYQQFLRAHKFEAEFNGMMRFDKNAFSNITAESRTEAKEKAQREFASDKQKRLLSAKVKEVENISQQESKEKIETFKKGIENAEDDLDQEWKKLFRDISNFESKLYNH